MSASFSLLKTLSKGELESSLANNRHLNYDACYQEAVKEGHWKIVKRLWLQVSIHCSSAQEHNAFMIKHLPTGKLKKFVHRIGLLHQRDATVRLLDRLDTNWTPQIWDWVKDRLTFKNEALYLDTDCTVPRIFTSEHLVKALRAKFTLSLQDWRLILSNLDSSKMKSRFVLYDALVHLYGESELEEDVKWIQRQFVEKFLLVAVYDQNPVLFSVAIENNLRRLLKWVCMRNRQLPAPDVALVSCCEVETLALLHEFGLLQKQCFFTPDRNKVETSRFSEPCLDWMCDNLDMDKEDFAQGPGYRAEWFRRRFPDPESDTTSDLAEPASPPELCECFADMLLYLNSGAAILRSGKTVHEANDFLNTVVGILSDRDRETRAVKELTILPTFNQLYVYTPVPAASDSDDE